MTSEAMRAVPEPPAPPAVVSSRFSPSADLLARYVGWLSDAGIVRGLIGPREVPRLWDRHVLNSAAVAELVPDGARIVDIGTGAGLPGIVLACVRPDLKVDLVESLQRRTDFLTEVVTDLGLGDRVRVVRGRAEDRSVIGSVGQAGFVTARAVAPLDRLARWCAPLLVPGGHLLAMKGAHAHAEVAEHTSALRREKLAVAAIRECGSEWLSTPTVVVDLVRR